LGSRCKFEVKFTNLQIYNFRKQPKSDFEIRFVLLWEHLNHLAKNLWIVVHVYTLYSAYILKSWGGVKNHIYIM